MKMQSIVVYFLCSLIALLAGCVNDSFESLSDQEAIHVLKGSEKENLSSNLAFNDTIKGKKIYFSMTTSPVRIKKIENTIETLNFEHVSKLLLIVPAKFMNTESYPEDKIVLLKKQFPNIEILRPAHDLGPITKLLPAIEYVKAKNEDAIIITVDDDIGYPTGMPDQLIKTISTNDRAVAGGKGMALSFWNLNPDYWPREKHTMGTHENRVDFLEGFHAIAYPSAIFTKDMIQTMKSFSSLSNACRASDDLIINYVLASAGVSRILVSNKYFHNVKSFSHGFLKDALRHGAGYTSKPSEDNVHFQKYPECLSEIHQSLQR